MFRSLLNNLGSLSLAFLLALMVWMVARNEGLGVPVIRTYPEDGLLIRPANLPEGLIVAGQLTERATVELRGPPSNIDRLLPSDFEVSVDLGGLSSGTHQAPVRVACAKCKELRVDVMGQRPDHISVTLEEFMERAVPVRPGVQGSVADGYRADLPTADPQQVTVSGPRSVVERVKSVRADVYLINEDHTVTKDVLLLPVDDQGNIVTGVNLEPRRVTVTVPIVVEGRRKEVAVTPIITGTVAPGYYASGISVDPQTILLTGPRSRIQEAPGFVETEPVSIDGAKESVQVEVPIIVPEGLWLVDQAAGTVTVRVEISPFTGGRVFEVVPLIQNLGLGLRAEVAPSQLQVFLSGPLPDLQALQEDDVQVVLDLSNLPPGRHRIVPMVIVSQGSLQIRTLPEEVEVTITMQETPTPEKTPTPKAIR